MKNKVIAALFGGMFSLASVSSYAVTLDKASTVDFRTFVTAGYGVGGDTVATQQYTGGSDIDISAGAGYTLGAGIDLNFSRQKWVKNRNVGVKLWGGYHRNSESGSNADLSFSRFEYSFTPYYGLTENLIVSVGASAHFNVEMKAKYNSSTIDEFGKKRADFAVEYDPAWAVVAELMYKQSNNLSWSLRATSVEYAPISLYNYARIARIYPEKKDGNNVAIFLTYTFGK